MMTRVLNFFAPGCLLMTALLVSGCLKLGEGRGEATRHFTLSATSVEPLPAFSDNTELLVLGLGPLRLAAYLDRPQIVTRTSAHQLHLADTAHWAEPLTDNILRTLAANLIELTGGAQVLVFPWRAAQSPTHQVTLHVEQFDSGPDDQAHLRVFWTLRTHKGGHPEVSRLSTYSVLLSGSDPEHRVAALSDVLAAFSVDLSQALAEMRRFEHPLSSQPLVK